MTRIECVDCGSDYEARRKDATRCPPCRLLAMLTYAAKRFGGRWTCQGCRAKFRPAGKPGRLCGECEAPRSTAEVAECRVCKEHRPMYERVEVCLPCVKNPDTQPTVVRALRAGQKKRKTANA